MPHQTSFPHHPQPRPDFQQPRADESVGPPAWEDTETWQAPGIAAPIAVARSMSGGNTDWSHRQNGLPPPQANPAGGRSFSGASAQDSQFVQSRAQGREVWTSRGNGLGSQVQEGVAWHRQANPAGQSQGLGGYKHLSDSQGYGYGQHNQVWG